MSGDDDELRGRQREEEAARDRVWDTEHDLICRACGKDYSHEIIHHPCRCPVCGQDHREDHRGSDGGWVDFPDHEPALVKELLVP